MLGRSGEVGGDESTWPDETCVNIPLRLSPNTVESFPKFLSLFKQWKESNISTRVQILQAWVWRWLCRR